MKKFNFSMQKVLEYKEHIENKEKNILMQKRLIHKNLCEELEEIKNKYNALKTDYIKMCSKGVKIREMAIIRSYMAELEKKMEDTLIKIENAEYEIERQINKIVEIAKEKNTLEKLKEKYYSTYLEQKRKGDELFIDELASKNNHVST